jgi:hypothetical protein
MSTFPPKVECSVCGRIKGELNRWYLVHAREAWIEGPKRAPELDDLLIAHFSERGRGVPACGNNCTQKLVERWLQTGSLEPPRGSALDGAPRAGVSS